MSCLESPHPADLTAYWTAALHPVANNTTPHPCPHPTHKHKLFPAGITRQLFLEDRQHHVGTFLAYDTEEFVQTWPLAPDVRQALCERLGRAALST